jgi:hypothetical protein
MPITYIHDGTSYRKAKEVYIHDGTDWRSARKIYTHDGTSWRKTYVRKKKLGGTTLPITRVANVVKANGDLYACLDGVSTAYTMTKVYKYIEASDQWDAVGSIFTGRAESSPGSGYYFYDICSLVFYRAGTIYACGTRFTTLSGYPYYNGYNTIYSWNGSSWVVVSDTLFEVYPAVAAPAGVMQSPILFNDELYCDYNYFHKYNFSTGWSNIGGATDLYWIFKDPGGDLLSCSSNTAYSPSDVPCTVTSGTPVPFGTPPSGYNRFVGPIKLGADYYAFLWDGSATRVNGVYKLTGGVGTWTLVVSLPNTEYIGFYAVVDDTLYIGSITYSPTTFHQYYLSGSSLVDITDTDLNMDMLRFDIDNTLIFKSGYTDPVGNVWMVG